MTLQKFINGHALIIGTGSHDIPITEKDAVALADILRDPKRCAYPPEQVHLLTNENANKQNILASLNEIRADIKPEDTLVFYFSGHGCRVKKNGRSTHYLLPNGYDIDNLETTALLDQKITEQLASIPAQKLLVILDCCHAGGIDLPKSVAENYEQVALPPEILSLLQSGRGKAIIASSRSDEVSYTGNPYSKFTMALIEALTGRGNTVKDGFVRVADIAMHAAKFVPSRTQNKQNPILDFEKSDNFRVAYYAAGRTQAKSIRFDPDTSTIPDENSASTFDQRNQQVGKQMNISGDVNGNISF